MEKTLQKATFAAGCFWGVESRFRGIPGVKDARVGYTGGNVDLSGMKDPYKRVCSGTTGHAEAVEVIFDPREVSYEALVQAFFSMHDPTQRNRQGPDVGTQYRSAIFYHDDEQRVVASRVMGELEASGRFRKPIATEIVRASTFHEAEAYHQRYFEKHGGHGCGTFFQP